MLLETLRYAEEVRKADSFFDEIEKVSVDDDQLALAKQLIERKTAPFDPEKFHDDYASAVKQLIAAKVGGESLPEAEEEAPASNVINLMDALKRSVSEAGKAEIQPRAPKKTTAKKAAKPAEKKEPAKRRKAGAR
jgi:DNA end-binding protein Ku